MSNGYASLTQQVQGIGGASPAALSGLGPSPQVLSASGLTGSGANPFSAGGLGNGTSALSPLALGAGQNGAQGGVIQEIMTLLEEILALLEGQGAGGAAGSAGAAGNAGNAGAAGNAGGLGGGGNTLDAAFSPGGGTAGASGSGQPGGPAGQVQTTPANGQAPQNSQAIYKYLTSQGLSPNAAAGIIGNIAQESGGDPESVGSGGNGLIGWTPPLAGAVTGNPQKDLAFQLPQIIKYINQNGSIADINAHAGSPTAAAIYFQDKYERPAPATENQAHRVGAANAVAQLAQNNFA